MASSITKKTLVAADLSQLRSYLYDSDTPLSSNFTFASSPILYTAPVSTPGIVVQWLVTYPTKFSSDIKLTGTVEGAFILQLYASQVATSAYVRLTDVQYSLRKYDDSWNHTDIIPLESIWSGSETLYGAGTGSTTSRNIGFTFSKDIDDVIHSGERLGLLVQCYGFKSTSATGLMIGVLCDKSAEDLKLSVPLLEDE